MLLYQRVFEQVLREAQKVLWANLPPIDDLPDAAAVEALRKIMGSSTVKVALDRGPDIALAFAVRETIIVLADKRAKPVDIIRRLWAFLDHPELNRALEIEKTSRIKIGPKKPPSPN